MNYDLGKSKLSFCLENYQKKVLDAFISNTTIYLSKVSLLEDRLSEVFYESVFQAFVFQKCSFQKCAFLRVCLSEVCLSELSFRRFL